MKSYVKKQEQPMIPFEPFMNMKGVSISDFDKLNGSPKAGDMIAIGVSDPKDRWLVSEQFFLDNYKEA